jgi:hypothetical protein
MDVRRFKTTWWVLFPSMCLLLGSVIIRSSRSIYIENDPHIKVLSPNGNEQWQKGQVHFIHWNSDIMEDSVSIHFSSDGAATYSVITNATENDGTYEWVIPEIVSNQCVIQIRNQPGGNLFDISDAVFFITSEAERFILEEPNGNEIYEAGTDQNIRWSGTYKTGLVNLYYNPTGFDPLEWITIAENIGNTGLHLWRVPDRAASGVIRIQSTDNVNYFDQSDQTFQIITGDQTISLLQPNGGEIWPAESLQEIVWTGNLSDTLVKIEYSINGGNEYQSIVNETANDGIHTWTVPMTKSNQCKIRISGATQIEIQDESDHVFTINGVNSPEIMVTTTRDTGIGSLREAILQANQMPGLNLIHFAIPTDDPGYDEYSETFLITPQSSFDAISDSLVINGRSQLVHLGLNEDQHRPLIEINGSNAGEFTPGISILVSNVTIHDLIITGFSGYGITLYNTEHVLISGCYLGVGADGLTPDGNYMGVHIYGGGHDNIIAGLEGHPNIIGGNEVVGVFIQDTSHHNLVADNLIGVGRDSLTLIGNGLAGVALQEASDYNTFIGNMIGGNPKGIQLTGGDYNEIIGNFIGGSENFENNLGNTNEGIYIAGSGNNSIIENTIGYNGTYGVSVVFTGSLYNRINGNRIALNQEKGISCVNGGNNELQPPVISHYENSILSGSGIPGQFIEVFFDTLDQGLHYYGTYPVENNGRFELVIDNPPSDEYSATATATDSFGNTSEFSLPYQLITGITDIIQKPIDLQIYPNPFDNSTTITYHLPQRLKMRLDVTDNSGKTITILGNEVQESGIYTTQWDGKDRHGAPLPSGVYFLRLHLNSHLKVIKMILIHE